jgi:hypothetical protein
MKYIKFLLFMIMVLWLLAAICYRFIWPLAPAWLDALVYGGAALVLLVGLSKRNEPKENQGE